MHTLFTRTYYTQLLGLLLQQAVNRRACSLTYWAYWLSCHRCLLMTAVALCTGGRRMATTCGSSDHDIWCRGHSRRSFHVAWTTATHSYGIFDGQMMRHAVCPECCCTSGLGRSTAWPHHGGATPVALASGSKAGGLQDGHLDLQFTVQHDSGLPGRWLSGGLWRRSSSAAFCRLQVLCRRADLQQLWRPMFRGCRSEVVLHTFSWS